MIELMTNERKARRSRLYLANDILTVVHLFGAVMVPIALLCAVGAGVLWCVRHVVAFASL
jgi:hypothetical protein